METSLTVLYTANLRGDLDLMPRLYSFIRQLKAYFSEEAVQLCPDDPAPENPLTRFLLLDLGDSCAPDAWHCQVTGGRSSLVVLDSMGYDAANVTGFLTPEGRAKLDGTVRVALVDDKHPFQQDWMHIVTAQEKSGTRRAAKDEGMMILLQPAKATNYVGNRLSLARVNAGQVGIARICMKKTPFELEETLVFDLPRRSPPDPTIAGIVDFVTSEARYVQKKHS